MAGGIAAEPGNLTSRVTSGPGAGDRATQRKRPRRPRDNLLPF